MYLTRRFYILFTCLTLLTGFGYVFPLLFTAAKLLWAGFVLLVAGDALLLYHRRGWMHEEIVRTASPTATGTRSGYT